MPGKGCKVHVTESGRRYRMVRAKGGGTKREYID